MSVCLDTTYFVDLVRGPEVLRSVSDVLAEEAPLTTTVLNVHEILAGTYPIKDPVQREALTRRTEQALARVAILPCREEDARLSAEIAGKLLSEGVNAGLDALVAAIALNNGVRRIVTRNVDHFNAISAIVPIEAEGY
jgi:predicted nucleic acid-binding protein